MRILCVCQKGNMRSVALAWLLKKEYEMDALAMGVQTSSITTKNMLYQWADIIILTSNRYKKEIPREHRDKLKIWHVGTDKWFKGHPDDLVDMFRGFIKEEGVLCFQ